MKRMRCTAGDRCRWLLLEAACAALLGACAAPQSLPGVDDATRPSPPPGRQADSAADPAVPDFAAALARGLPYAVGVYAVDDDEAPRQTPRERIDAGSAAEDDDNPAMVSGGPIGAGVVLRADGLIATAGHVVKGASRIVVKLPDDRILLASLLGIDNDTDIALLKVAERWPAEPLLGHSGSLKPGNWVVAIGEPFALERTVVAGIVGGPLRHFLEDREVMFIQSSITFNPGDSGGPLLDAQGRIVGMNVRAIAGPQGMAGIGLTLPIEVVLQIAQELLASAHSARPPFGATFEDLLPPEAFAAGMLRASGAVLRSVRAGGTASRLGLRERDIIVGLNGQPVGDSAELARLLLEWRGASSLRATVHRAGGFVELRLR